MGEEGKRERESFIPLFTPLVTAMTRPGPGQSQKLLSTHHIDDRGPSTLPSSAASPQPLPWNWISRWSMNQCLYGMSGLQTMALPAMLQCWYLLIHFFLIWIHLHYFWSCGALLLKKVVSWILAALWPCLEVQNLWFLTPESKICVLASSSIMCMQLKTEKCCYDGNYRNDSPIGTKRLPYCWLI